MADEIYERRLWQHGAHNRRRGCMVKEKHDAGLPQSVYKGKEERPAMSFVEENLSNESAHVQRTNGGNDNNGLDPSASTTVSSQYPGWWRDCAIAPKQVARARMLEECGHDPELLWEVIECIKRYYRAVN